VEDKRIGLESVADLTPRIGFDSPVWVGDMDLIGIVLPEVGWDVGIVGIAQPSKDHGDLTIPDSAGVVGDG
jgi:hypothetical protein